MCQNEPNPRKSDKKTFGGFLVFSKSWEMQPNGIFLFFPNIGKAVFRQFLVFPMLGKPFFAVFSVFPMLGRSFSSVFRSSQVWESPFSLFFSFPKFGVVEHHLFFHGTNENVFDFKALSIGYAVFIRRSHRYHQSRIR